MSKFFPYMHEGPRRLSELSEEERAIAAGHLGYVANVLGRTFTKKLSNNSYGPEHTVSLWLCNPDRSILLLMEADLQVGETSRSFTSPRLFLAGLGERGAEELHSYSLAQTDTGLLHKEVPADGRVGAGVNSVAVGLAEANGLTADIVGSSPEVTHAYRPVTLFQAQHLLWPAGIPEQQAWPL